MAPAMPCKACNKNMHGETRSKTNYFKSHVCMYLGSQWIHKDAYGRNSTEISWGPYRRKRRQFTTAWQYGTQIYSYASSNEDTLQQKQQWIKNGRNWEKDSGVGPDECQKYRIRGDRWSKDEGQQKFILPHWWTSCHLKNAELEAEHQKI